MFWPYFCDILGIFEGYFGQGEIGRDPSSYVPADFGARGLVRNRLCGGSRRLYAILNGCCCCLGCGRCAARDISDTFSRLAPIEPVNDDDEDEEEETVRITNFLNLFELIN